jgi:hypothetical protein
MSADWAPRGRRTDGTGGLGTGALARGSGGGDDGRRRRLGGQAERRQEPAHGVGLRHRAQDPPRTAAARKDQDLDRETPGAGLGPDPAGRGRRIRVRRVKCRRIRDDGWAASSLRLVCLNVASYPTNPLTCWARTISCAAMVWNVCCHGRHRMIQSFVSSSTVVLCNTSFALSGGVSRLASFAASRVPLDR